MRFLSLLFFISLHISLFGQCILQNPSFEDTPSDAMVPNGWMMCNQSTTPDILPGFWGVNQRPSEGRTYVGLITRANGTYESIGQRIHPELSNKECYRFTLDLAYSHLYAGYNTPIRLRVYVSKEKCKGGELIFESAPIKNTSWETKEIKFTPKHNSKYIRVEAYSKHPQQGNILIDKISPITLCNRV